MSLAAMSCQGAGAEGDRDEGGSAGEAGGPGGGGEGGAAGAGGALDAPADDDDDPPASGPDAGAKPSAADAAAGGSGGGDAGVEPAGGMGGGREAAARGLIARYRFTEPSGAIVADSSGVEPALDLEMFVMTSIDRLPHGVRFKKPPGSAAENADPNHTTPIIRSAKAADKLNDAIVASNAFSVELWIKPTVLEQSGPGRIVSIDYTNYELTNLNVMHGPPNCGDHGAGAFVQVRMGGDGNACPALPVPSQPNVTGKLQHLVLTQDGKSWVLYSDGAVSAKGTHTRTPSQWNKKAGVAFGNLPYLPEAGAAHGNFRYWQGELFYVGFHDIALTEAEVKTNASIPYLER